nr:DEAD/DEAH box helicase [uncultured Fretibacterium sp.]
MRSVFDLRKDIVKTYADFSKSFSKIAAADIREAVDKEYEKGRYWPEAMLQLNPHYKNAETVEEMVARGALHPDCARIFCRDDGGGGSSPLMLYQHQVEAIDAAGKGKSFIVTTGTGSGKSLAFFIPIVDRVLKNRARGIRGKTSAIVIYPMNALANSQMEELKKYLGMMPGAFTFARYTGQEDDEERLRIADSPPDILLTNFMMLELILTRYDAECDRTIVKNCQGLNFLVLDELHTYRGRQGADVAMLVRRLREHLNAPNVLCIGTSATMRSSHFGDGDGDGGGLSVEESASRLFGCRITADQVIGEALERVTNSSLTVETVRKDLERLLCGGDRPWHDRSYSYENFCSDPLAVWVELTLGIDVSEQRAKRASPLTLSEAAARLARDTGVSPDAAREILSDFLVSVHRLKTPSGKTPFAFKLHQFISGPGRVSCTLEPAGTRVVTLDEQIYAPNREDKDIPLFHTYFCRECGQEFHPVTRIGDRFERREIDDVAGGGEDAPYGFIAPLRESQRYQGKDDLPDDWFDYRGDKEPKLKRSCRGRVPERVLLDARGRIGGGEPFWYMAGKFGYCVNCGVSYSLQGRDANRLTGLSGEGRSSASTILTLAAMNELQREDDENKKILGFVDNRQDAALQAGHFNDFVFLLMLRSGLWGALEKNGGRLSENDLADAVFEAMGFGSDDWTIRAAYMRVPDAHVSEREKAKVALCNVLGYRLLHDQRKGWRYNYPNLEQLKMIEIGYVSLEDFCRDEDAFARSALRNLSPDIRRTLYKKIFDTMRQHLCIDSVYLNRDKIESIKRNSSEQLVSPWSLEEGEITQPARILSFERISRKGGGQPDSDFIFAGPRSALVRMIRGEDPWRGEGGSEIVSLILDALEAASKYGFVQTIAINKGKLEGYRLKPSCLEWRVCARSDKNANPYFESLYRSTAERLLSGDSAGLFSLEAHEHTAQVAPDTRKFLEWRFRCGPGDKKNWEKENQGRTFLPLPVLYCSPTMELGVDISALNVVYMRNVPPTPANYAQRSGRAGRSGQPALILTYCAAQSPHDQWYFRNQTEIVQGIVRPPSIDLTNQELFESHLHAVWLASMEYGLGFSIAGLLDLGDASGKHPRPLKSDLAECCRAKTTRERALAVARRMASALRPELERTLWYRQGEEERVIEDAPRVFDRAFDRWRDLLAATERQRDLAREIMDNYACSQQEKADANQRHRSAVSQLNLLTSQSSGKNASTSDFYVYRYLANQGFLPGYNFPRLPLMAWVPAGKGGQGAAGEGRMVTRPRFLALSEFGPRSLIYHEGNAFRVVRAKLNVGTEDSVSTSSRLATVSARICPACGYCHIGSVLKEEPIQNVCDHCGTALSDDGRIADLYRVETVETFPVERINANDEERRRQGYELQTTYSHTRDALEADVLCEGTSIARLSYSPSACLWRVNKGWRRRKKKEQFGFFINPMSGYWNREGDPDDTEAERTGEDSAYEKVQPQRIVPFVEDHRNIVTLTPEKPLSERAFATIQSALAVGMERFFQIENAELAVEPLPSAFDRKLFLFYESAEGGAGVLQRLCGEKGLLAGVARKALAMMHYAVPDGAFSPEELGESESETLPCVAGCYSCLLSYYNQPEHRLIDRHDSEALEFLAALANSQVLPCVVRGGKEPVSEETRLSRWLELLQVHGGNRPDETSREIMRGRAIVDACYKSAGAMIFFEKPEDEVLDYLADRGLRVVVFPGEEREWLETLRLHREIFFARDGDGWGEDL